MKMSTNTREILKRKVLECLVGEPEITQVVIFGSFLHSGDPHDMDIAVFQDSDEKYIPLAMKYRSMLGPVAREIALDVFPIRTNPAENSFLREVKTGEVVYERRD
jgi:predicted nucleotidyltransferase